eukprot:GSMAST32.ASY1.ANO1.2679.1 assembled CDS
MKKFQSKSNIVSSDGYLTVSPSNSSTGNSSADHVEFKVQAPELIRIVLQGLSELGYYKTAETLSNESGVTIHSEQMALFRRSILDGDWTLCLELIPHLKFSQTSQSSQTSQIELARFFILREKYLELLEQKKTTEAIKCLRTELFGDQSCSQMFDSCQSSTVLNSSRLKTLSPLVLCSTKKDLLLKAKWAGTEGGSRIHLLNKFNTILQHSTLVPESRLRTLLGQSLQNQIGKSLYRRPRHQPYSLLNNNKCMPPKLPTRAVCVLEEHNNEVWHIEFSKDSNKMCSSSKDGTTIIWDTRAIKNDQFTKGFLPTKDIPVMFSTWSPDDLLIVTCHGDGSVYLWDALSGDTRYKLVGHTSAVISAAWLPDGKSLVTGGIDKKIILWEITENIPSPQNDVTINIMMNDIVLNHSGTSVIVAGCNNQVYMYNLVNRQKKSESFIKESGSVMSMKLTDDGRYLLLAIANKDIQVWDIQKRKYVLNFKGPRLGRYVIHFALGGEGQCLLASGSEDSQIYLWYRITGTPLSVLSGHAATVNCVSWATVDSGKSPILASCSDDHTVRIWR